MKTNSIAESTVSALINYKNYNKIQKLLLKALVDYCDETEIKSLTKTFKKIDKENTGVLSCRNLINALANAGYNIPIKDIEQIFHSIDIGKLG